ncbi:MAG: hypothetical protein ACYTJ0_11285 [Planctomycetota bacterium]|jgi:hypothetical protein
MQITGRLESMNGSLQRVILALLLLPSAIAAPAPQEDPGLKRVNAPIRPLEPVDQMIADRSVLSTSLRVREAGLQEPSGFSSLYRLTDPEGQELLMRADGGLYAVFPQSVYAPTRRGLVPVIPAGTRFYIGPPPTDPADLAGTPDRGARRAMVEPIDFREQHTGRFESRIPGVEPGVRVPAGDRRNPVARSGLARRGGMTIATDERYRLERLRALLERATRSPSAAKDGSSGG